VDPDGKRDEERAGEEEHLVAAEVPAGQPHGDEEHDARRDHARLRRGRNHRPARAERAAACTRDLTRERARSSGEGATRSGARGWGSRAAREG